MVPEPDSFVRASPGFRRVGWCFFLLGGVGILRLLPEAWSAGTKGWYLLLAAMDLALAILSLRAGHLLKSGSPDAAGAAMTVSGPLFLISLFYAVMAIGEFRLLTSILRELAQRDWAMLPRVLYYLAAFSFLPYGVFTLLRESPASERADLRWTLVGSTLFSALFIVFYVMVLFIPGLI